MISRAPAISGTRPRRATEQAAPSANSQAGTPKWTFRNRSGKVVGPAGWGLDELGGAGLLVALSAAYIPAAAGSSADGSGSG
jgi:hypothetical protein